jgi:G3E family GTPase
MSYRTPVTILTGFLGSGKTTLLNRILTERHGLRIAVIENEFGEIGIDHELVINAEEEIFEMNNGCICCTVRGDLIRIMGNLAKRRDKFDHVIIETTGLADPGPVVQTFFVDTDIKESFSLDAVITLVDAKHVLQHIDESTEAKEQIAFADILLLNKSDLLTPAELDRLEARIKSMNGVAQVHRTVNAQFEVARILNVGGFNLERAIGLDPKFLEPEYPFEWGGLYLLPAAPACFVASQNPDPSMRLALIPVSSTEPEAFIAAREQAVRLFSSINVAIRPSGSMLEWQGGLQELILEPGSMAWPCDVPAAGNYAVFTQHYPAELDLRLLVGGLHVEATHAVAYKPDHEHDEEIGSVGIQEAGDCDSRRLDAWLSKLLREQGGDIFRMKGVFAIAGSSERTVFQGVHMLLDVQSGGPWETRPRKNSLVFIGRNLDRAKLISGFRSCLKR